MNRDPYRRPRIRIFKTKGEKPQKRLWVAYLNHPTNGWLDYMLHASTWSGLCQKVNEHVRSRMWLHD